MEQEPAYIPEFKSKRERESFIIKEGLLKNNFEIKNIISFKNSIIKENAYIGYSREILNNSGIFEQYNTISDFLDGSTETLVRPRRRGIETRVESYPELREIFRPFAPRTNATAAADVPLPIPSAPKLTDAERASLALKRRAAKLRSPHFQALLRFVRATPHLWDQVQAFQERRDMMLQKTGEPGENHRQFAPLLAGMAVNAETRAYLQISLDEAAKQESDGMKAIAEVNGGYYAPVLVVGAGIHGSIFNAQLMNDRPDLQALTVDKDTRLGGNFRKPNGRVFRTNSRNRAEDRTADGLPGADGNINSLGQYATMQVSDISSEVYADNDTFGLATALNQYLSGNTMLGVEVTEVERNGRGEQGKYKVTLEDVESGKTLTVTTDVVVVASGLGERKYGLDESDVDTTQVLVDNFELALATGKMPKVIPYDIFLQLVGDRRVQFPLEPFVDKRIAVVGSRDSSNTTIEYLLGLGSEYRGSVAQMGRPQQIAWYGPEFKTQAEYRACARLRYAEIGTFLPRVEGQRAPILPVAERVNHLRQTKDGKITVLSNGTSSPERAEDFDFVILATGFEDQKAKVFTGLYGGYGGYNFDNALRNVESRDRRGNRATVARQMYGESVYFIGPAANIPVGSTERSSVQAIEIPENSVAIWRYSDRTAATARTLAMQLPRNANQEATNYVLNAEQESDDVIGKTDGSYEFSIPVSTADRMFPPEVNYANLLRIRAFAQGSPRVIEGVDYLTFTVDSIGVSEDGTDYRFNASMAKGANEHQVWMRRFLSDKVNQHLIAKLTRTTPGRVILRMPVSELKSLIDEIEVVRSRKTK